MEITEEYRSFIENIVKSNSRFSGNEDLVEDFCSETIKRSYSIISSVNSIANLEGYLNKVASSAIIEVLKNSGRIRRSKGNYVQVQETPISNIAAYNTDKDGDILYDIPDPAPHFEERILIDEEIGTIKNVVTKLNEGEADKKYLDLFILRYIKGSKQSDMAEALGISQSEVSKRLVELIRKINENINAIQ